MGKTWGWQHGLEQLASFDLLKIEKVAKVPHRVTLAHLSYMKDKAHETNTEIPTE